MGCSIRLEYRYYLPSKSKVWWLLALRADTCIIVNALDIECPSEPRGLVAFIHENDSYTIFSIVHHGSDEGVGRSP